MSWRIAAAKLYLLHHRVEEAFTPCVFQANIATFVKQAICCSVGVLVIQTIVSCSCKVTFFHKQGLTSSGTRSNML